MTNNPKRNQIGRGNSTSRWPNQPNRAPKAAARAKKRRGRSSRRPQPNDPRTRAVLFGPRPGACRAPIAGLRPTSRANPIGSDELAGFQVVIANRDGQGGQGEFANRAHVAHVGAGVAAQPPRHPWPDCELHRSKVKDRAQRLLVAISVLVAAHLPPRIVPRRMPQSRRMACELGKLATPYGEIFSQFEPGRWKAARAAASTIFEGRLIQAQSQALDGLFAQPNRLARHLRKSGWVRARDLAD